MNTLKLIRYAAWAAIAALAVLSAIVLVAPRGADKVLSGAGATVGGPFTLASATGGSVDSATLKGKPYAVFFGFTQCPDICPTTMYEMTQNLKALDAKAGSAAKDFRVYFITVDPERDDASLLKDYLSAFDPRIVGLIPKDQDELARIAKSFRIYYKKVPQPGGGYTMDHSAAVLLYDKNGDWAGTVDTQESDSAREAKLERLLKG